MDIRLSVCACVCACMCAHACLRDYLDQSMQLRSKSLWHLLSHSIIRVSMSGAIRLHFVINGFLSSCTNLCPDGVKRLNMTMLIQASQFQKSFCSIANFLKRLIFLSSFNNFGLHTFRL